MSASAAEILDAKAPQRSILMSCVPRPRRCRFCKGQMEGVAMRCVNTDGRFIIAEQKWACTCGAKLTVGSTP